MCWQKTKHLNYSNRMNSRHRWLRIKYLKGVWHLLKDVATLSIFVWVRIYLLLVRLRHLKSWNTQQHIGWVIIKMTIWWGSMEQLSRLKNCLKSTYLDSRRLKSVTIENLVKNKNCFSTLHNLQVQLSSWPMEPDFIIAWRRSWDVNRSSEVSQK